MQRITITIDDDLASEIDETLARRGYQNRSETIRDLVRIGLKQWALDTDDMDRCVGVLSYVYDHASRDLAKRLTATSHHSHDLIVSSLHVHLNEHMCLEISVLKGPLLEVRHFAEKIISERAVRYGALEVIPQ